MKRAAAAGVAYVPVFKKTVAEPPPLLPENVLIWQLWSGIQSEAIVGGFGVVLGVSKARLPWLMERHDIPIEDQLEVDEKVRLIEAIYVNSINRRKEKGDG